MTPSRYSFSEYSPEWPVRFREEAERLKSLLGDELIAVHHIGSTSVPGLAAKDIVDMLPLVKDLARLDGFSAVLEDSGYQVWGEYGLPGRRYFTRDRGEFRTHNIHMYREGDPAVERHLAFCAYLRAHDAVREEYQALKREVFARHPDDINAYMDGKDAWIKKAERSALEWYRDSR